MGKNAKTKREVQDWTSALGYGDTVSDYFQIEIPFFVFCTCS